MTIQQAFQIALQHHEAGRFAEAEALYRQILAVDPRHAEALHHLGVIAHQVGRDELAVELIRQAIALIPSVPAFHSNLGEAQRGLGQLDEAIAAYRQAIALMPHFPEVYNNLGNALKEKDQLDEAILAYHQAIGLKPDYSEAYYNLGIALSAKGQCDPAIAAYRQSIHLNPALPEAHSNLSVALRAQGQLDEAIAACRQAIALKPNYPEAHNNLGNALLGKGAFDEAITVCRQAIALKPDYPEVYSNLGNALQFKGKLDEAIAAFRQAVALKPDLPEALSNLGNALRDKGQLDEAIAACRQAIALKPNYPEAYNNLGNALLDKGQLDEAIADYRQAIAFKPDYPEAHCNLGNILKDEGRLDEAISLYRQAVRLKPDDAALYSTLVFFLHYHPDYDAQAIAGELDRWNRQFADPLRKFHRDFSNGIDPERRLRVGYLSPDFCDHVVGRNVLPVLERHDRAQFEIYLYAHCPNPDALSLRFERAAGVWRNIAGSSDQAVAELIRADQIDILIDLSLHTPGNRLLVMARKPAPVQVTWAGYPGTTGLDAIDYRLTDPYLDPPETSDEYYSEKSIRLPQSFWCYHPLVGREIPVNPLPARSAGHVTFGSLNNYCKINQGVLELWSKVLGAVKDSRLLLLSKQGVHRQRALEMFQRHGVDANRIQWCAPMAREQYLEAYHRIDLGLDTFPYNGHTTSLDSFWMGVPVITLVGKTVVGRGGLSQAMNLGLPELVARTPEQYLQIVVNFSADLSRLAELRQSLRRRMQDSPLMDAAAFTRDLEAAYRAMWRHWCRDNKPSLP